jgi:hypothetical protein
MSEPRDIGAAVYFFATPAARRITAIKDRPTPTSAVAE